MTARRTDITQASTSQARTAQASTAQARARRAAEGVTDPELPMLTLADLGVLRAVEVGEDGTVTVDLTPTYIGCPAMAEMRADMAGRLRAEGFTDVRIRTVLSPPWTTDWITAEGRRTLTRHGIAPPSAPPIAPSGAPPGAAPRRAAGPRPLTLLPTRRAVPCPRCGSGDTEETSRFAATPCLALWRCRSCAEPFEHVKDI